MVEFDKKKFKKYIDNRKSPTKTPKDLVYDGITIKNVPVIMQEEGSHEFTIPFDTLPTIYKLLAINNGKQKIIEYKR